MRHTGLANTVLALSLACPFPAPAAQEEDAYPPPRRYVPPPAPKSVEIADFYFKTKKYPAALSRYQEAVQTDPYYSPGYLGLGKVYDKIGLKRKALEAYRKYLDTLPSAKDAERATEVRQALARLERDLKPKSGNNTRAAPSSGRH